MAVGRILKKSVEAIPAPEAGKRAYLWDDQLKGFGVMVTPAGSRSYLVQFQMGGRGSPTRRATIGQHGRPWTADDARERAKDLLFMIHKGIDPLEEERKRQQDSEDGKREAERLAFADYADLFGRLYVDRHALRSADEIKAVFRRDLTPHFKRRSIASIRRGEITSRLDAIVERSPSAAVKAHKWLRKMFLWAINRGDVAASPMEGMPPPAKDGERNRYLKGDELRAVWLAAEKLGEPYTSFVRMLILTGQRLREVAFMGWSEIDLEKGHWHIPGARTKNKRDHLVPLPPQVVAILSARFPDKKLRKGPVFTTDGKKPINGFSKPKRKLDEAVTAALAEIKSEELPIMQPWVLHDLRRSFSTGGQALGFSRDLMHATINHISGGKRGSLDRVYQLHDYYAEKVTVMASWARHIETIVSGETSNVVPLAAARA
jgi:integrase